MDEVGADEDWDGDGSVEEEAAAFFRPPRRRTTTWKPSWSVESSGAVDEDEDEELKPSFTAGRAEHSSFESCSASGARPCCSS